MDIRRCPHCGAALRVLAVRAVLTPPRVVVTIPAHLETRTARAPTAELLSATALACPAWRPPWFQDRARAGGACAEKIREFDA